MHKKCLATPEFAKPKHQSEYCIRILKIILGVDAGSRRASARWLAGPNERWAIPTAPHGRFMCGGEGCHSEAHRLLEGLRRSSPSLPGTEGPLAAAHSRKASTSSPENLFRTSCRNKSGCAHAKWRGTLADRRPASPVFAAIGALVAAVQARF